MTGPLTPTQPLTTHNANAISASTVGTSPHTPPLAFTPMSRIKPIPRTSTQLPRPIMAPPADLDMKAPPSLRLKENIGKKAVQAEKLLNNFVENPEYGDLAKTVVTSLAGSIEIGKFVHSTLKDFQLTSTLTGNGIMALVVGSAVAVGGSQIIQKIPGSRASINAKTDYCIQKITEEIEMRSKIQDRLGETAAETGFIPGTPEFDAAVEICVQELKTVPTTNNLTLGKLREFVQDLFAHIRSIISLFKGNSGTSNT